MPKKKNHRRNQATQPSAQAASSSESSYASSSTTVTNNHINSIHPNSIFTFFPSGKHEVNWYVHRDKNIRNILKSFWGHGPKKTERHTEEHGELKPENNTQALNTDQLNATKINALFRSFEREGPFPENYKKLITPDNKHGACNRPKENCFSKGFYHCHVSDQKNSVEVMWLVFENYKIIHIVDIGSRENFDFERKNYDVLLAMNKSLEAAKKANFNPEKPYNAQTYNNSVKPQNNNKHSK